MSDPVQEAIRREEQDRLPFIYIHEFRTEYKTKPDGSSEPYDVVAWGKKGVQNPAITEEKVARLEKNSADPLAQMILPAYKRWKEHQAAPIDGIPLAAWPGATPQLVKALEPANIRSVEDLARMEDSAIMKISIPGLRDKQKQARAFLEAKVSTAGVAAENAKLKETVEAQATQIAELKAAVEQLAETHPATTEVKRGPGRPRKIKTEEAA